MNKKIDYYFTSISPFTYLGHSTFLETAQQAEAEVNYKPIMLGKVFANSGALPLPERPRCRQSYRLLEIERWARKRGLPVNPQPTYFPTDPGLSDRCVIALQESDQNAGTFLSKALTACWSQEENIAEEVVLHRLLTDLDIDADKLIRQAQSQPIRAIYETNTHEAIEQGILGAPSYVFNGEQFWGQDRLELLADALR